MSGQLPDPQSNALTRCALCQKKLKTADGRGACQPYLAEPLFRASFVFLGCVILAECHGSGEVLKGASFGRVMIEGEMIHGPWSSQKTPSAPSPSHMGWGHILTFSEPRRCMPSAKPPSRTDAFSGLTGCLAFKRARAEGQKPEVPQVLTPTGGLRFECVEPRIRPQDSHRSHPGEVLLGWKRLDWLRKAPQPCENFPKILLVCQISCRHPFKPRQLEYPFKTQR